MKEFIADIKKIIHKCCANKEMTSINIALLAMLCVACIVNIFAVLVNENLVEKRKDLESKVSSGVVEYMGENDEPSYFYAINGEKQEDFTGLAEFAKGSKILFFDKGEWVKDYQGMVEYMGDLCFVRDGVMQNDFTGIALADGRAYSILRGRSDPSYDGMVQLDDCYYILQRGAQDVSINEFIYVPELDEEVYFDKGACDFKSRVLIGNAEDYKLVINNRYYDKDYTGAVRDVNDVCYLFRNGYIDESVDGQYYFDEGFNQGYYIEKGVTATDKTILVAEPAKNRLILLTGGRRNKSYTGIINQDGKDYYVKKGNCKLDFNDKVEWDGKVYKVENGIVVEEVGANAK